MEMGGCGVLSVGFCLACCVVEVIVVMVLGSL